jgi:hypothetical protein
MVYHRDAVTGRGILDQLTRHDRDRGDEEQSQHGGRAEQPCRPPGPRPGASRPAHADNAPQPKQVR